MNEYILILYIYIKNYYEKSFFVLVFENLSTASVTSTLY